MTNQSTTTLVAITGNTYPVKEQLKSLGARWNPDQKAWMVSADKADEARALVPQYATKKANKSAAVFNQPCRRCGTYCYGDCESN